MTSSGGRWLRVLGLAGITVLVLLLVVLSALQIPAVATWAGRQLTALIPLNPGYEIQIGNVGGNWLTGLTLRGIRLVQGSRTLAEVRQLEIEYNPSDLLGAPRAIQSLKLEGAHIVARRQAAGWDVANAFGGGGDTTAAASGFAVRRLELDDVQLTAELNPDSLLRIRNLTVRGHDLVTGPRILLQLDTLHATIIPPGQPGLPVELAASGAMTPETIRLEPLRIRSARSQVAGAMVFPRQLDDETPAGRLKVRLRAAPLDLADVAAFFPPVLPEGRLWLDLNATGKGRLVSATLDARLGQGTAHLEGTTRLGSGVPVRYRLDGRLRQIDPSEFLRDGPAGVINGTINLDLQGDSLTASGGRASLRLVDSRIGDTRVTSLALTSTVRGGRAGLELRGRVDGSTVDAEGWVRPFDSMPTYRVAGVARSIPGGSDLAQALTESLERPDLNVEFRVAGKGVSPSSLALTGAVSLVAAAGAERVTVGSAAIRVNEGRLRARPELLVGGGRVGGLLLGSITDTITYQLRQGTIERVNLARLLDDTSAAPVSGRFSLEGRGLSPEAATMSFRLALDSLRHHHGRLDEFVARGQLRNGRVRLRAVGRLQDGRLAVQAAARPFASPVSFTADSLVLERVDLGALLGRPDLSGPFTLRGSGSARWGRVSRRVRAEATIEPSRLGRVSIAGGAVSASLDDSLLTYDASVRTSDGSVELAGEARPLDAAPVYRVQRGRVDSLNLGELLGRPELATSLEARFTAMASGRMVDSISGWLEVDLLPSRVNDAELGPGRIRLSAAGGQANGTIRIAGKDAELEADLSGELAGEVRRFTADGTLRVEHLDRWTADSGRTGRVEASFALETLLDSTGVVGASGVVTAFGGMGGVRVRSLHAVLEPDTGSIVVDTLILRSNVAVLDGSGSIALRRLGPADTLRLLGRTGDINAAARLAGIDSLTLDSARVALTLSGTPSHRGIEVRGVAHRLLYASTLVEQLGADVTAGLDTAGLGTVAGTVRVEGLATGGLTVREARLEARYDSIINLEGSARLDRDVRLRLALQGSVQGDSTAAHLSRLQIAEGGRTWELAAPAAFVLHPERLAVESFDLRTPGGRRVALDGVVALQDTSDLTLRFDSVDLGTLHQAGLAPVPGRLDGLLHLRGPPRAPTIDGRLALTLHDGREEDLGRIESALEWTRRGLELRGAAAHQQGGRLIVSGTLPWGITLAPDDTSAMLGVVREPGDTMNLRVRADSFEVALLRPFVPREMARDLHGELAMDARVRGTPEKPSADGTIRLAGLGLEVPAINLRYERGRLAGAFNGDVLRIDTLLLHTGDDQTLAAQGLVRLLPLTNPALELDARLTDFAISRSARLRATASGRLRLGGTVETPVLTGTLRMGPTEFFATGASGLAVEDVELTPEDRLELARHFGPSVLAGADGDGGLLERFRLDLDLRLPGQVWFRRPEAPELNVEVAGRLRLRQGPGGEMRLFGSVEPVPGRSTIDVYGRTFGLTGGEIVMQGPVEETWIDVTAEYQVQTQSGPDDEGVVINVAAQGSPDSLVLELSSDPEMPRDDMISYIVTGRPSSHNPLVGQSGAGGEGEQLVLSQLTEVVSTAVGEELGFDVFQIRQDGTQGLMLIAGRYLTPQFYLSLQQPLEVSGQDERVPGANLGPGFQLQYRLNPRFWVTMQGGSLPSGVLLRGRHAY